MTTGAQGHGVKRNVAVTISRDTTYITEPLRADGYPDYLAALTQQARKGVTPENNAVVLIVQALGPELIDGRTGKKFSPKEQGKFFTMLGVAQLPKKGDYLVSFEEYVKLHKPDLSEHERYEQSRRVSEGSWSKNECPLVAAWLAANEKPLARITEASKRPRFYAPIISRGKYEMGGIAQPFFSVLRHEVAHGLLARALLALHEGHVEQAWADLQTCHRLGRLLAQGPTIEECIGGITIDWMAAYGDWQVAHFGHLTPEQAQVLGGDQRAFPLAVVLGTTQHIAAVRVSRRRLRYRSRQCKTGRRLLRSQRLVAVRWK